MEDQFFIGQIFQQEYPPEVAAWCDKNNALIKELPEENGVRIFQITQYIPQQTKIVRTFAKDAIWVATKDLVIDVNTGETAWEKFKNFLLDSGLWEGWSMQAYLLEENPFFAEFYPRAVEVFGNELVDSVLEDSVVSQKIVVVK